MYGNIFHKTSLDTYFTQRVEQLNYRIDSLSSVNIENDSAEIYQQFSIAPLSLYEYQIGPHVEGTETVSGPMGTTRIQTLTVSAYLPFDGDSKLFECTPSSSRIIYLTHQYRIEKNRLVFSLTFRGKLEEGAIQKEMSRVIRDMNENITTINSELDKFNLRLSGIINELLLRRQERINEINRFRGEG